MARLSVLSERVKSVVDQKLVPLFFAERSTAALCKALNRQLSADQDATIHPNRIHALLSDDISRGVNEKTLELIARAADALCGVDGDWESRSAQQLKHLQGEVRLLQQTSGLNSAAIQRRLSLPPAVIRRVLIEEGAQPAPVQAAVPKYKARKSPDWSFQEVAISRTLEAFRQRPTSKVGLILPTGAGKTRTALRIVLKKLDQAGESNAPIYWVTHRKNLRTQAHRELQKLLSSGSRQIPEDAATLLGKRISFVMVSELPKILAPDAVPPLMIVVDEAHHAAAPSYQPIFEADYPVPALFLTATPNRSDSLPIGIDEIAFTITYRELEERGVVVMPEFLEFPVDDFEWAEEQVQDLADYVIDRARGEFTKTLLILPTIDRVEEFYKALCLTLSLDESHPLELDDIGFIHGTRNSLYINNDDFIDIFAGKPRGIIVSAQILLEGFDDPAINTVILTYPSNSVVRLMQAAGRCVRYSPEKNAAYVVQAKNEKLAYHFDQRWLYQEISDYLRPELIDIDYASEEDLQQKVSELLDRHNVNAPLRESIEQSIKCVVPGETCRLLFYGFPYYEVAERFEELASWGSFHESPDNSVAFRGIFNAFCVLGAHLSDPTDFLMREGARFGVKRDLSLASMWTSMMKILTASYFAREEVYGSQPMAKASRPMKSSQGPTTWLRYVTFHFRPELASELTDFLVDCYNRKKIIANYIDFPDRFSIAVKIPLPLDGHEAWLLTPDETRDFETCIKALREKLLDTRPADQFGVLAYYLASADHRRLPSRILVHAQAFLGTDRYNARVLQLPVNQAVPDVGDEE